MASWYEFEYLLSGRAWLSPGWLQVDTDGRILTVTANRPAEEIDERVNGFAIPGMVNLHSHAFQRAMAGLTEQRGDEADSFWTWRDLMYRFVHQITPEDVEAIASQLYLEMVKAGYTSVAEFHYLHHAPDGRAYDAVEEMSARILAAAEKVGIGLTHLPVLYAASGFGGLPPSDGQRRFINTVEALQAILEKITPLCGANPSLRIGLALHSLRAVPPEMLRDAVAMIKGLDHGAPIHIHIAEQVAEVQDCLAWSGQRPVEWLLNHVDVDRHWCLVHATHLSVAETVGLARSGAVAGLCPTTEANLGDGFFPLPDYVSETGYWGIGSDSHISISPVEELRWLEYGQRLLKQERNVSSGIPGSTGEFLYQTALSGGAQALGRASGMIVEDRLADLVVLDQEHPALAAAAPSNLLDTYLFSGNTSPVRDVMICGQWVVRAGATKNEGAITEKYVNTVRRLVGSS